MFVCVVWVYKGRYRHVIFIIRHLRKKRRRCLHHCRMCTSTCICTVHVKTNGNRVRALYVSGLLSTARVYLIAPIANCMKRASCPCLLILSARLTRTMDILYVEWWCIWAYTSIWHMWYAFLARRVCLSVPCCIYKTPGAAATTGSLRFQGQMRPIGRQQQRNRTLAYILDQTGTKGRLYHLVGSSPLLYNTLVAVVQSLFGREMHLIYAKHATVCYRVLVRRLCVSVSFQHCF